METQKWRSSKPTPIEELSLERFLEQHSLANAFIAAGAYEDLNSKCNLENRCSQLTWVIDAFNNANIPSDAIPPSQNITWFAMEADDFGDIDGVYEFPSGLDNSEPVKHCVTPTAAVPRAGSWDDAAPLVAIPCASAAPPVAKIPGDGTDILDAAALLAAFLRSSAAPLAAKVVCDCSDIWYDVAPITAVPCAPVTPPVAKIPGDGTNILEDAALLAAFLLASAAPLAAKVVCDCSDIWYDVDPLTAGPCAPADPLADYGKCISRLSTSPDCRGMASASADCRHHRVHDAGENRDCPADCPNAFF